MQSKLFDIYDQENSAVQDAYALLTANVHFINGRGKCKTITLTSWEPRVGKTTVAINLAISLARSGWRTLLVDTDIRKPGTYKRLNNEIMHGLSDIILDNKSLVETIVTTNITNLTYLPVGKDYDNSVELLCSPNFSEVVEKVKDIYDFVLFDTPALASVIDGALVASATDGVLLVAEIGKTKLTALKNAKEQLEKAQTNIMGVVINKVKKRDYVKYAESYNYFARYKKKAKSLE